MDYEMSTGKRKRNAKAQSVTPSVNDDDDDPRSAVCLENKTLCLHGLTICQKRRKTKAVDHPPHVRDRMKKIMAECYKAVSLCEEPETGRRRWELFKELPDKRVRSIYTIRRLKLMKKNSFYYRNIQITLQRSLNPLPCHICENGLRRTTIVIWHIIVKNGNSCSETPERTIRKAPGCMLMRRRWRKCSIECSTMKRGALGCLALNRLTVLGQADLQVPRMRWMRMRKCHRGEMEVEIRSRC